MKKIATCIKEDNSCITNEFSVSTAQWKTYEMNPPYLGNEYVTILRLVGRGTFIWAYDIDDESIPDMYKLGGWLKGSSGNIDILHVHLLSNIGYELEKK